MIPESIPIVIDKPEFDTVEIYGVHDLHYGNECFDVHRWNEFTKLILSEPNRFVVFVGDLMENAVPNSKSDVFSQTATPCSHSIKGSFLTVAAATSSLTAPAHKG